MPLALEGVPAGVKFCPTDNEILEHLAGKIAGKAHHLIDEFIPTLEADICHTHPDKLPGTSRDGKCSYFFHRPANAYARGTRKRRKVEEDEYGGESRWHKTGITRRIQLGGDETGWKKIMVLYTFKKHSKPVKTNWVVHQYHIGNQNDERGGQLVVSKVFYQTQTRKVQAKVSDDEVCDLSRPVPTRSSGAKKVDEDDDCDSADQRGRSNVSNADVATSTLSLEQKPSPSEISLTPVLKKEVCDPSDPAGANTAKTICLMDTQPLPEVPLRDILDMVSHEICLRDREHEDSPEEKAHLSILGPDSLELSLRCGNSKAVSID